MKVMKVLRKLAIACCVAALAAAPAFHLAAQSSDSSAQTAPKKRTTPVDLNSATSEELQTLKGIDSAAADKIIAGRPYVSITQLVSKGILTKDAYNAIRDEIVAKKAADDSSSKKSNKKNNNNNNRNKGKSGKGRR